MNRNSSSKSSKTNKYNKRNRNRSKSTQSDYKSLKSSDGTNVSTELSNNQGVNDPKWWYPEGYENMLNSVAKVNFNYAIGISDDKLDYKSNPGLMVYRFLPTLGISTSYKDHLSDVARALYITVLSANKRQDPKYEAPDLVMYIAALANAQMAFAFAGRVYGTLMQYNFYNRYIPDVFFEAWNLDVKDFHEHMNDFKAELNILMKKLQGVLVPTDFKFIDRYISLCSDIYMDETSTLAQLKMFVPECFYKYDELHGPTRLIPVPLFKMVNPEFDGDDPYSVAQFCAPDASDSEIWVDRPKMGVKEFMDLLNDLVMPLRQSQDVLRMASDIVKAFGTEAAGFSLVPDDYVVEVTKSGEIDMFTENIKPVGDIPHYKSNGSGGWTYKGSYFPSLTQSTGINNDGFIFEVKIVSPYRNGVGITPASLSSDLDTTVSKYFCGDRFVNVHGDAEVTPEVAQVISRGIVACKPTTSKEMGPAYSQIFNISACGTEIWTTSLLYEVRGEGENNKLHIDQIPIIVQTDTNGGMTQLSKIYIISRAMMFNGCHEIPIIVPHTADANKQGYAGISRLWNVDHMGFIDTNQLEDMHKVAIMGAIDPTPIWKINASNRAK